MRYWVFTSNPGHFRMSEALIPGETLDWPTFGRFKFEVGDVVFIYSSSPVLQMTGKLEIEETGLQFSDVNPRNDLRKWPRYHSNLPWMRMRVLQSAPVPFRPLQRGSLYYHTEFKPSPYPKLLHDNEREYVLRAFDEAMTYSAEVETHEDGIDPKAVERVNRGEIFRETAHLLKGGEVTGLCFSEENTSVKITLVPSSGDRKPVTFSLGGIVRARWDYLRSDRKITGIRLSIQDTYLLLKIDGAEMEILTTTLTID